MFGTIIFLTTENLTLLCRLFQETFIGSVCGLLTINEEARGFGYWVQPPKEGCTRFIHPVQLVFWNKLLKVKEHLIQTKMLLEKIYPSELVIVINKIYTICLFANITKWWTQYIRKGLFQRNGRNTSRDGLGQLITYYLLTGITHIQIYFRRMGDIIFY